MAQLGSTAINGDLMVTGTIKNDSTNAHTLDGLNSKNYVKNLRHTTDASHLAMLQDFKNPFAYVTSSNPVQSKAMGLPEIWWHIVYYPNGDSALSEFGNNGYGFQIAYSLTGSSTEHYERSSTNTGWHVWKNILNADTLDGLNSTDFSFSKTITLAELNDVSLPSGIYNIQNITLDSVGLPGSYAHIYNGGGYGSYGSQIAIPYSNGTMNGVWYRVANGVYPIFKRIDNISYGTTASTTANAYGVTLVGATLTTGQEILLKFNSSNTIVNPTLNVNVLGAKGIKFNGNDLLVNMIPTNAFIPLVYDGSYWQITSLDTAFNYVATTASATANAYTVSYPGFNLVSGMMIPIRFNSTNTVVAPTLNINGTGAKPIKRSNLPLVVNEITANEPSMVYYDGASYQVFGIEDIATNILMTGYTKGTSVAPIVATDTVGSAIGKLETGKAPLASPTFTGTVGGITKAMVGLSSVDNTADSAKPVSTAMLTALNLKAPLASPALIGTPTAPTAVSTTNTTQIATTAFVKKLIEELIGNSPAALDTLKELATALGNDPNFATTMTNLIATKAPLASPVFTGTPKSVTPARTSNDTSIATTSFTQDLVAKYIKNFNATTDWTGTTSFSMTIAVATHGKGITPHCEVYFLNGANYERNFGYPVAMGYRVSISTTGNITVTSEIQFAGRLVVI